MSRAILIIVGALVLVAGIWFFTSQDPDEAYDQPVTAQVEQGPFEIYVTATGELKARNSVQIKGPQGMREAGVYRTTISDLVPEGTVVQKGEYVAKLDRTEVENRISEIQTEIDKVSTQLEQAKIDTAIELRGLRDQILNLKFSRKEKELVLQQSQYEPKMIIRQAELDLERTDRDMRQTKENYRLKQIQAKAKIGEILATMRQSQVKLQRLLELSREFTITAPQPGMVIYQRGWGDEVKGVGSQINAWDPVVAELPDLSEMISITYVNEVDIRKVRNGQDVEIRVDAFPDNVYTGRVIKVANIGQQLRGQDSKVFKVTVMVNESDSTLRPAMTTSNKIRTYRFEEVVFLPLEAVHTDSLTYAIVKEGGKTYRQEIVTGESNEDAIIVNYGLEPGQTIYLHYDGDPAELEIEALSPEIKEEILAKEEEARKSRMAEARKKEEEVKGEEVNVDESGGMNFIIFD